MKALLLLAITLTIVSHSTAQAKVTAEFKTVLTCVTAENPSKSEILVDVQESKGQAQLLVKFAEEDQVAVVQARKLLPLKYAGKIAELSNHDILLEIGAPTIKVGKFKGRSSLLSIDQLLSNLPMICTPVID